MPSSRIRPLPSWPLGSQYASPSRLSDPEFKPYLDRLKASFRADPKVARDWLVKHGLLTRTGKLPKKYGG